MNELFYSKVNRVSHMRCVHSRHFRQKVCLVYEKIQFFLNTQRRHLSIIIIKLLSQVCKFVRLKEGKANV